MDSDGDLDIAVYRNLSGVGILLNDGQGGYLDTGQVLTTQGAFPYNLSLGDIDTDGDLDLVVGTGKHWLPFDAPADVVFTNDGNGTFTDSGQALGPQNTHAVVLGDVNGDEHIDFITGTWSDANRFYLNNGKFGEQIMGLLPLWHYWIFQAMVI